MESFEHVCKVALESEGFVVISNVKFYVRRQTRKAAYAEYQEHGYEVDLVGARGDALVLAGPLEHPRRNTDRRHSRAPR